ncbi:MAG: DUF4974 domain-containing protein [Bacteroidales bacterium]|nr:DUF4974 domain-containing protein [Bacteroidales bacterium]
MDQAEQIKRIRAFFNGQLTSLEEQELSDWIKADEKNRSIFETEKRNLSFEDISHEMLENSLAELKMKIDLKLNLSLRKFCFKLTRIAAIFVLIIGLGFLFSLVINNHHKPKQEITWFETNTKRGEKSKINLPDGSKVWLNGETTIRYPNDFTEGNRTVKLSGEAYFEVARDENNPFVINSGDITTTVLGTSFNLSESNGNVTVTVASGKVMVTNERNGQKEILVKNDQLSFNSETGELNRATTDSELLTGWSNGVLHFNNITIAQALERIEKWYNVTINCDSESIKKRTIQGRYQNKSLDYILEDMEFMLGIKYHYVNDNTIVIK